MGKYDKLKNQYTCLNGVCMKCYYFGTSSYTCDYFLITNERRGVEVKNCDKFFPEMLCRHKENAYPYYNNSNMEKKRRNICITAGGRVFDAESVAKRVSPMELINGEWKQIQIPLTHNEILSSKPLAIGEYKRLLKTKDA